MKMYNSVFFNNQEHISLVLINHASLYTQKLNNLKPNLQKETNNTTFGAVLGK